MKKNFIKYALLVAALIAAPVLTSCSDDDGGENTITDEDVVKDNASAIALANGSYGYLQKLSSSFSFIIELQTEVLTSFEGEEDEAGPLNSRFEHSANTWYQIKVFGNLFLSIDNDNTTITKVTEAHDAGKVDDATFNAAIGKVKLLRGLSYLYLVQLYGPVPVYTEAGGSATTRASIDEVYAQIIKDLTDAESKLSDYNGDPRTPSKQAAQALLARAYLIWGNNPLTDSQIQAIAEQQKDPEFTKDSAKLQKAYEYAKKVVDSGKLKLDPEFAKLFGRDYESNKRGTNEHLLTIAHDGDEYDAQGNHQTHCSWTYPYQNGQNGQGYSQNHTEASDDDLFDNWLVEYPGDSIRLAKTYIVDAVNPDDNLHYTYYYPYYTPINGKGYDESYQNAQNLEITHNSVDRIEVRYAEVLLIAAEALVQLDRNAEAAKYLNQIQDRAGVEYTTNPSFDDIKREWLHEFTYEQKLLLNHYRWKDLISGVLKVKGYKHYNADSLKDEDFKDNPEAKAYFQKIQKHLIAKATNVRGKHYRQPIPLGLQGNDLGLPQNPGF